MALNLFWLTQCLPRQPPSLTLLPLLELKFSRPGPPKPACMGRNGAANRFPVQVTVRKNTLWQKKKKNAVHIPFWFSFSHYRKRRGEAEVNAILSVWLKKKMDYLWVCLCVCQYCLLWFYLPSLGSAGECSVGLVTDRKLLLTGHNRVVEMTPSQHNWHSRSNSSCSFFPWDPAMIRY